MSGLKKGQRVAFQRAVLSSSDSSEDDMAPGQQSPSEASSIPAHRQPPRSYKVYPLRWLLLGSLCLVNISNGMVTHSFLPPTAPQHN